MWAIPPNIKNSQTKKTEVSNKLTESKRSPLKLESDRGSECYNSISREFLKAKNKHHFSRLFDKGPSIAKRVIRSVRNLLKTPVFEKGNANWLTELP